ncbi:hypothetical protein [Bacillus sp. RIT 809]|uniref:hypothetical protein n=1 Tax=Bacillus sp. RIT 809 TaxID=2803857 RepID=UPI00194F01CE|nr:hypothetical protein [Bacillus sp. RIT 809]MBM6649015.1 hypothetical protein [Bacillus sp. RIT 809]
MKKEHEHIESLLYIMNERVKFLTNLVSDYEKEIKENEGYGKGLYKGFQMVRQDELDFLQNQIDYFSKKLKENNESEEAS